MICGIVSVMGFVLPYEFIPGANIELEFAMSAAVIVAEVGQIFLPLNLAASGHGDSRRGVSAPVVSGHGSLDPHPVEIYRFDVHLQSSMLPATLK